LKNCWVGMMGNVRVIAAEGRSYEPSGDAPCLTMFEDLRVVADTEGHYVRH